MYKYKLMSFFKNSLTIDRKEVDDNSSGVNDFFNAQSNLSFMPILSYSTPNVDVIFEINSENNQITKIIKMVYKNGNVNFDVMRLDGDSTTKSLNSGIHREI